MVRVESAFALELQHLAPMVIERINAHLGWRCIGRIVLKQAPLPRRAPKAQPKPPPSPATTARAREATEGVTEERLQQALIRFGEAVLGQSRAEGPRTKS